MSVQDGSHAGGPGVIVVAEGALYDVLAHAGVEWRVQDRQDAVGEMWQALSSGTLDQHSRILVFSDSLKQQTADDDAERQQAAAALVAMANAGAVVFVAQWRPERWSEFEALIDAAALAQGVDRSALSYGVLPVASGGRAVLEAMRANVAPLADLPADFSPEVEQYLPGSAPSVPTGLPAQPPAAEAPAPEPPAPAPPAPEPAASAPVDLSELSALEDVLGAPAGGAEPPAAQASAPAEPPTTFIAPPPEMPAAAPSPPAPAPAAPAAPAPAPAAPTPAAPATTSPRPSLPPIGGADAEQPSESRGEYPPSASLELLERPKRPGQITITVTSSKGGSGKSTASIMLAGSIARASAHAGKPLSVCLIDLDTRDGQVASLIGKFMPTALNIRVQPVWDEERIRRNLVQADGLQIDTLLAPIRPRTADTVGPDFYRTIVRSLQRMYDVIVMDTSVQYLEPLIAEVALRESDEILFVTTLASTAVQGMARALREITAPLDESGLGIPREKIGIIVNQSVANVGMERDQVLAAGLGVPVVGVVPLATKDVLTATNLNRMYALLDHPLLGPAYNELAQACLPGHNLGPWTSTAPAGESAPAPAEAAPSAAPAAPAAPAEDAGKKRGLFRR
jgi:cellulose biosynthesis protein BcsQ